MSEKASALHSPYIIDGVQQDLTPAQLLDAATVGSVSRSGAMRDFLPIADETLDPLARTIDFDSGDVQDYLSMVSSTRRILPLAYATTYTRQRMATALIDAMWNKGKFRFEDLSLIPSWSWNEAPVGAMAAFYESASAASEYADALGLWFDSYSYLAVEGDGSLEFKVVSTEFEEDRAVPAEAQEDVGSWLIYIPFDSSDYRLGGSLLAQSIGLAGAVPKCDDVRTFVDCYEVVREFVEDGVLLSAVTVGEGGLLPAVKTLLGENMDMEMDVSDVLRAYQEKSAVRVLFSEVPGVVIQIRDYDFDYVDAELLLQDVLYFPLGCPFSGSGEVKVKYSRKSAIETILDSLMQNAEGED